MEKIKLGGGVKMLYAYAEATMPKIRLIKRRAHVGANKAICKKRDGGRQSIAWPSHMREEMFEGVMRRSHVKNEK